MLQAVVFLLLGLIAFATIFTAHLHHISISEFKSNLDTWRSGSQAVARKSVRALEPQRTKEATVQTIAPLRTTVSDSTAKSSNNSEPVELKAGKCKVRADVIYWRDEQLEEDRDLMVSSDAETDRYVVFQPDVGGWYVQLQLQENLVL